MFMTRSIIPTYCLGILLSASALTGLSFPSQARADGSIPDGTIPSNIGMQLKGDDVKEDKMEKTLDDVKALGVKWVRRGFNWESMEKELGVYDFSKYDTLVKACNDRGLAIIGCMTFSNKLYGHVKDEPARLAYAKWAAALTAHFKDANIVWEIWNEPNTMTFWGKHGKKGNSDPYAEEYTNLVKAVVPAMKAANPKCVILAGSVSNMWTESYKWMGFCFAKGMLKQDWDVWSVHPYGVKSPEDYIEAYGITKKLMDDAGGPSSRPWMNSERGFPLGKKEGYAGGAESMAREYQAWHLVRQYLVDLMLGVRVTIWYEWSGKEGFALCPADQPPTPAFKACKELINQLSGYKIDKRLDTAPRDLVLRFTNPTGAVKIVAWTAPPPMESPDKIVDHDVSIPVEATGKLTVASIYGETREVEVKNGKVDIKLTGAPQYIVVKQ